MKRNVTIYGLILGILLSGWSLRMVIKICKDPIFVSNDIIGYATMIMIFSLTFFGIRNYRNKELNGFISLGKAFKVGALIALIGSTMYVVIGLSYYHLFAPEFVDKFIEHALHMASQNNATEAELAAKSKELMELKELYKNPLFAIFISYMEVLPIGLIVAFISSLILRKKQPE